MFYYDIDAEWRKRLKELRMRRGMSFRDMAIILGTSPSTLCRLETGKSKKISADLILALSNESGEDFTPVLATNYPDLKRRISELEKENRMLRDYIREKWDEEALEYENG